MATENQLNGMDSDANSDATNALQYLAGQFIRVWKWTSLQFRPLMMNLKGFDSPNYFALPVKNSFVVSMTTSPTRLSSLGNVFRTFSWSQIQKVIVTVPKYFRNDPTQT
jgi:hypothetical protein